MRFTVRTKPGLLSRLNHLTSGPKVIRSLAHSRTLLCPLPMWRVYCQKLLQRYVFVFTNFKRTGGEVRSLSFWHINKYGLKFPQNVLWVLGLGLVEMWREIDDVRVRVPTTSLLIPLTVFTRQHICVPCACVSKALKRKVFPLLQSVPVLKLVFELSRGPDEALGGNIGWIKLKHGTVDRAEQSMNVCGGETEYIMCGELDNSTNVLRVSNFSMYGKLLFWTLSNLLRRAPINLTIHSTSYLLANYKLT